MLLTGEPEDVLKKKDVKIDKPGEPVKLTPDNMCFSSSNVKSGEAVCIVVETGMRTRVGRIAELLTDAGAGGNGDGDGDGPPPQPDIEQGSAKAPPKKKKKEQPCIPDTKAGQSPLQASLEELAVNLGYMAIAVCMIVFIVGVAMSTKDPEDPDTPSWLFMTPTPPPG